MSVTKSDSEIYGHLRPRPLMRGPVRSPPATMPQAAIPTGMRWNSNSIFYHLFRVLSDFLTYPGPVLGVIVLVAKLGGVG